MEPAVSKHQYFRVINYSFCVKRYHKLDATNDIYLYTNCDTTILCVQKQCVGGEGVPEESRWQLQVLVPFLRSRLS